MYESEGGLGIGKDASIDPDPDHRSIAGTMDDGSDYEYYSLVRSLGPAEDRIGMRTGDIEIDIRNLLRSGHDKHATSEF